MVNRGKEPPATTNFVRRKRDTTLLTAARLIGRRMEAGSWRILGPMVSCTRLGIQPVLFVPILLQITIVGVVRSVFVKRRPSYPRLLECRITSNHQAYCMNEY